jgi:hypothetical protein
MISAGFLRRIFVNRATFVWKCCVVFIPFSLSFSSARVVRKHGFCAYPEQRNSTQTFSLGRPAA